jgi:hypothetical protein
LKNLEDCKLAGGLVGGGSVVLSKSCFMNCLQQYKTITSPGTTEQGQYRIGCVPKKLAQFSYPLFTCLRNEMGVQN